MTEEEANTKWCPFVRMSPQSTINNRGDNHPNPGNVKCIGSACMAFRQVADFKYELSYGLVCIMDQVDSFTKNYKESWIQSIYWDGRYVKITDKRRLHVAIAERCFGDIPKGYYVDHIDGNTLNNRRGNLRIVTPQQSGANQKSRGGKSKYRGVFQQESGRWTAQLSSGGIRWCLGTYDTEKQAAEAYDDKAKKIHGEYARLNLESKTNSGAQFYCGLAGTP